MSFTITTTPAERAAAERAAQGLPVVPVATPAILARLASLLTQGAARSTTTHNNRGTHAA